MLAGTIALDGYIPRVSDVRHGLKMLTGGKSILAAATFTIRLLPPPHLGGQVPSTLGVKTFRVCGFSIIDGIWFMHPYLEP